MPNRENQVYEQYWSYTAAKTDLNGASFLGALRDCVEYFDEHANCLVYEDLQTKLMRTMGIADVSVRKMINQFVKLGFLIPDMGGYRPETVEYLKAVTDKRRKSILSKTVYCYSNFNNSMTDPDYGGQGQINFFLKTLEEVGCISERELTALMTVDVNTYPRGYLTADELIQIYNEAVANGFVERKYNQIGHLKNLLSRLDDLQMHDNAIYFETDAQRLFGDDAEEQKRAMRDPYLQRVYKSELEEESTIHYECEIPKCMLEGIDYPVLIASHIKPYKDSNEDEAFDLNNGLLLSKNFDSLFDLGYITFDDEGVIIPSRDLSETVAEYVSGYRLHRNFINAKRMDYMKYHREHVFQKRYSTRAVRRYVL